MTIMASPGAVGPRDVGQAIKGPYEVISISTQGHIKIKCQSGYVAVVRNEQFQLMHA